MNFDLEAMIAALDLAEVGVGVVEGQNLDIGYHRVFGGQILAQVLVAAAASSPEKSVKSLHILFPREGDTSKPMQYAVTTQQEGRTFGATQVVASQDGKVIASAVVSLHADEGGLHRSEAPPAGIEGPEAGRRDLGAMVPWDTHLVGGVDLGALEAGPATLEWWMRTPTVGDERWLHQALLAHATDLTLIGTALRPLEGISQAQSTVSLHTAVTSHTLWFHQPFRVDDWLLVAQQAPVVSNGRSFGRGDVFAGSELVASFAQEAMVRQVEPQG